jgi:hypothetical protein
MSEKFKIGLIDSGSSLAIDGAYIDVVDNLPVYKSLKPDLLEHGTALSNIIASKDCEIYCAQVFHRELITTAQTISFAIDYLCKKGVNLIHMSVGLSKDREILKQAIENAISQNIIIVASAPSLSMSRNYPSSYKGVVGVTADARCKNDEISFINCAHAVFGASPFSSTLKVRGSSAAAAYITKKIAFLYSNGLKNYEAQIKYIKENAVFKTAQVNLSRRNT